MRDGSARRQCATLRIENDGLRAQIAALASVFGWQFNGTRLGSYESSSSGSPYVSMSTTSGGGNYWFGPSMSFREAQVVGAPITRAQFDLLLKHLGVEVCALPERDVLRKRGKCAESV